MATAIFTWSKFRVIHKDTSGTWWRIGWGDYSQPEGRGFDSRSSRHVGTLGKSFTCSCLCARRETPIQYPCCSRERLWVVEDLNGRYRNGRNEWMNESPWESFGSEILVTNFYGSSAYEGKGTNWLINQPTNQVFVYWLEKKKPSDTDTGGIYNRVR